MKPNAAGDRYGLRRQAIARTCPKCRREPFLWCRDKYVLRGRTLTRDARELHRERLELVARKVGA